MKLATLFLLIVSFSIAAKAQFISGKVVSADGKPLPGAEILVAENQSLFYTNDDGGFEFDTGIVGDVSVSVRYLGYRTMTKSLATMSQVVLDIGVLSLAQDGFNISSLTISALRNESNEPFTFENYDREYIETQNLGQDVPFLLNYTPSVVSTSDAGAGIGYTGLRIRGSDPSRVNVTINGIPYNDPESMQVFWVNLPDFASSIEDIQVQRGVGTSTNGAGAFGATINMNTFGQSDEQYLEFNNAFGSFNTRKHTLKLGTGWINNHWNFDARLSTIKSDGYIDRASSDLNSYYLNGSYKYDKGFIRATVFAGHEITYQSWNGTPEAVANEDPAGIQAYCDRNFLGQAECDQLASDGRQYNFYTYDNQVDNYRQDHYQLHANHELTDQVTLSASGHYTQGRGYFEQFKAGEDYSDYGLSNPIVNDLAIESTDLVRRRWLDNDFYGFNANAEWVKDQVTTRFGIAWNNYEGDHFGRIIKADFIPDIVNLDEYYFNVGEKEDVSAFAKADYNISDKLSIFGDIQWRRVNYTVLGNDNDLVALDVDTIMSFVNPKFGVSYQLSPESDLYASLAVANKEPDRNDFVDAPVGQSPSSERLSDLELGYRTKAQSYELAANIYYMQYKDQLVLTGALNDVGASLKTNVEDSYRLGLELSGKYKLSDQFSVGGNVTLSQNKIKAFDELIYDYTTGFDIVTNSFDDTDISFSPSVIGAAILSWRPLDGLSANWYAKYVGDQFLDNTSNEARKLDAFFVNNFQVTYDFRSSFGADIGINFMLNNVLGAKYSANGYTYSYIVGDLITENFLYPQAERNFMLGINIAID